MGRDILLAQCLSELGLGVLHPMAFVYDNVLPVNLAESRLVVQNILVGGQHHIELIIFEMLSEDRTLAFLALVDDNSDIRSPGGELFHPVVNRSEGHYSQERSVIPFLTNEVGEERNSLYSLTQAHLVSQNSIKVIVVKGN